MRGGRGCSAEENLCIVGGVVEVQVEMVKQLTKGRDVDYDEEGTEY